MSIELDDLSDCVEINLDIRGKGLTLRMYPDEAVKYSSSMTELLTEVAEGRGLAFFLPALPSDEGYVSKLNNGDWLYRSYLYLASGHPGDPELARIESIPAPILLNPGENHDQFLPRMNDFFAGSLKILPAGVFNQLRGWFPDEIGSRKHNSDAHAFVKFPILEGVVNSFRRIAENTSSYQLLYRMGLKTEVFLNELSTSNDPDADSLMLRLVKQDKYPDLRRFTDLRFIYNYKLNGF